MEKRKVMPQIEDILKTANEHSASDVHLTVGISPKMRVNGTLITMNYPKLFPADTLDIVLSIMTEAQRDKLEEQGEYDMSLTISQLGRYRVNAYRQRGSIALAFRLVGTQIPSPEEIGISDSVMDIYSETRGLVLVTGARSSGKSTTLAAIVDKMNSNRKTHIITIEDPIEFLHHHKMSMINQREIGIDTNSYVSALRAALREDPDVIVLGEIPDDETMSVAITAAETGHLVLSTLHTTGVVNTVERVVDMFPPQKQQQIRVQFSNVVRAIISQQLIPSQDGGSMVPAFEIMHANREVRNLIREGKTHQLVNVIQKEHQSGMITLDEAIAQLYLDGKISRDMAVQFAQDSEVMNQNIK